jgi:hypothetical protein
MHSFALQIIAVLVIILINLHSNVSYVLELILPLVNISAKNALMTPQQDAMKLWTDGM